MKKFAVIEDNGGGLTLAVFANDGNLEYLHTGYEYYHGQLTADIEALKAGANPVEEWDNNLLEENTFPAHDIPENPELLESWFSADQQGIGWDIIADNDKIYYEHMEAAGNNEFKMNIVA